MLICKRTAAPQPGHRNAALVSISHSSRSCPSPACGLPKLNSTCTCPTDQAFSQPSPADGCPLSHLFATPRCFVCVECPIPSIATEPCAYGRLSPCCAYGKLSPWLVLLFKTTQRLARKPRSRSLHDPHHACAHEATEAE